MAPNIHDTELKPGEHVVDKVVGVEIVEMSEAGRRYKARWLGYLGQDSWEREVNLAGARAAVEDFWIALEEPMPDSEVMSEVFRKTNEVGRRVRIQPLRRRRRGRRRLWLMKKQQSGISLDSKMI